MPSCSSRLGQVPAPWTGCAAAGVLRGHRAARRPARGEDVVGRRIAPAHVVSIKHSRPRNVAVSLRRRSAADVADAVLAADVLVAACRVVASVAPPLRILALRQKQRRQGGGRRRQLLRLVEDCSCWRRVGSVPRARAQRDRRRLPRRECTERALVGRDHLVRRSRGRARARGLQRLLLGELEPVLEQSGGGAMRCLRAADALHQARVGLAQRRLTPVR